MIKNLLFPIKLSIPTPFSFSLFLTFCFIFKQLFKSKYNLRDLFIDANFLQLFFFLLCRLAFYLIKYIIRMKAEDTHEIVVEFDRGNATYKPNETISGTISLKYQNSPKFKVDISYLSITPSGKLAIFNRQNNKKIEQISKQIKPHYFLTPETTDLAVNKTITSDDKIPFRFKLSKGEHRYLETYIGVFLVVNYEVKVQVKFVNHVDKLEDIVPFYVQVPQQGRETIEHFVYPKKKNFMLKSDSVQGEMEKFKIRGELESQICYFSEDVNGFIVVDHADAPIRSIDVQMYRVETIFSNDDKVVERTEIQMIQMCDGNVTRNLELPIYMILPRYYSCPSAKFLWCEINFQIDLLIIFKNGFKVTSNLPLKLIRS